VTLVFGKEKHEEGTMSLDHDFLLLDRETDGEWEVGRFLHAPRSVQLHDDLVRYMADTLAWVPTFNPARREPHKGLCMWGPTTIEAEGAAIAGRVFRAWADLFALGPPVLVLTGNFSWVAEGEAPHSEAEQVTPLEGGYDRLEFDREVVVGVLRRLAEDCERVRLAGGRLYLFHHGV
jgi:hypothetical protein